MKHLAFLCLVNLRILSFVSKYHAAGNFQWTRQLVTSGNNESFGVSADGLGNVYISGFTAGSLGGPNAGSHDAFVNKYDAAGTLRWSRQLGTSADDRSFEVSADGLGNVYFSGSTEGSLSGPSAGGGDAFVAKIFDPAVPEPSTFVLAAAAFAGLLLPRRAVGSRQRRKLIVAPVVAGLPTMPRP